MSFQKKNEIDILTLGAAMSAGGGGGTGDGDMKKAVYDTNNDGVVDAADTANSVSGHTVAKDVPADAVFTDTVYDDTALSGRVTALESHVTQTGDVVDSDGHSLHTVGEAIETTKTVSGNPITVTDALPVPAKSLITEINAIQPLHGYDHPWAGGAGKNKYPILISADSFSNQGGGTHSGSDGVLTVNVSAVDDGAYSQTTSELNKAFDNMPIGNVTYSFYMKASVAGNVAIGYLGKGNTWINATTSWVRYNITYNKAESGTANFIIYNKVAGARTIEIKDFMIEVGNSMSAYEPYSNICPISGRDSVAVDDEGKNLADVSNAEIGMAWNGAPNTARARLVIPCKASTTYTISINGTDNMDLMYVNDNTTVPASSAGETFAPSKTFTTKADSAYIIIGFNKTNISQADINALKLQLELGSSKTSYVPYHETVSATIQLGTTVYGAEINWVTGVMMVNRKTISLSGDTAGGISWETFTLTVADGKDLTDAPAKCSHLVKIANLDMYNSVGTNNHNTAFSIASGSNSQMIRLRNRLLSAQTADAYKAWFADELTKGTPVQVCYELATPTTIQLTPTMLEMLKGYNRVSIEDGTITLTYRANKADSVQAEVDVLETTKADNADVVDYIENGNTASRAYTANQFMLWKGDLYKVTTSIASGATITAGTNVSKTTIGAVLTAILNA